MAFWGNEAIFHPSKMRRGGKQSRESLLSSGLEVGIIFFGTPFFDPKTPSGRLPHPFAKPGDNSGALERIVDSIDASCIYFFSQEKKNAIIISVSEGGREQIGGG